MGAFHYSTTINSCDDKSLVCDACERKTNSVRTKQGEEYNLKYCFDCIHHAPYLIQQAYPFFLNKKPQRSLLNIVYTRYNYVKMLITISLNRVLRHFPTDLYKIIIDYIYLDPKLYGLWQLTTKSNTKKARKEDEPLILKANKHHYQSPTLTYTISRQDEKEQDGLQNNV